MGREEEEGGRSTWMGSRWGLRGFMERERSIGVRRGDGPGLRLAHDSTEHDLGTFVRGGHVCECCACANRSVQPPSD